MNAFERSRAIAHAEKQVVYWRRAAKLRTHKGAARQAQLWMEQLRELKGYATNREIDVAIAKFIVRGDDAAMDALKPKEEREQADYEYERARQQRKRELAKSTPATPMKRG